ncbi:MAG: transcriptional regulator [Thermodesulfobacteriota bacterium]|nr:DUF4160 domain-containing protein [Candidatus Desulfofervidus sp.]RKX62350.1 MAG: transcriptional regulator [Thermodesulfobacteriota bacterium]
MPEISRFYGIIIMMYYNDHKPPHFHAIYGEQEITVDIQTGMVQGRMSRRAINMVFEWYEKHKGELMENWELAENRKPLKKIPSLD